MHIVFLPTAPTALASFCLPLQRQAWPAALAWLSRATYGSHAREDISVSEYLGQRQLQKCINHRITPATPPPTLRSDRRAQRGTATQRNGHDSATPITSHPSSLFCPQPLSISYSKCPSLESQVTRLTGYRERAHRRRQGLVSVADDGIWTPSRWLMDGARQSDELSALHVRSGSSQAAPNLDRVHGRRER